MSEIKRTRIGEMEFWRFLFSIIIVLHHSRNLVGNSNALFFNGAYDVEFFFILSGYLLMQSIDRMKASAGSIGKDTFLFIKKKYLSLCPDLFIAWGVGAAATAVVGHYSLGQIGKLLSGGIWELSLLQMTGLRMESINGAVWYLSSMLICMAILYPILRKFKNAGKLVIIPLATLFIFGYLYGEFGNLRVPFDWIGWTYRGNLRAFADLGLGVICYQLTQKFAELNLNTFTKFLLTLAKFGSFLWLIIYMGGEQEDRMDFFLLLIIVLAIGLTFSRQTLGQGIFNNKFVTFLGKFSLPLYLGHYYWSKLLKDLLPAEIGTMQATLIYLGASFASAGLVMLLSFLWKKIEWKKLFIRRSIPNET